MPDRHWLRQCDKSRRQLLPPEFSGNVDQSSTDLHLVFHYQIRKRLRVVELRYNERTPVVRTLRHFHKISARHAACQALRKRSRIGGTMVT
jgi:hypothetical protein